MTEEMKRALLGDILNKVGMDGIGQVVMEQNNSIYVGQQQPVQMPPCLTRERATELYTFLIRNGYIHPTTSAEDFLYLMGVTATAPQKLKPINWQNTVKQLRTMLTLAFAEPLRRGSLRLAEIERRVPSCFLNKGKKMQALAKTTEEYSLEMDRLEEFFHAED